MAIPRAAMKKETGKTTLIAAIAVLPIQLPTRMVSTRMLSDITKIPIEAGTACEISNLVMGVVPSFSALAGEGLDRIVLPKIKLSGRFASLQLNESPVVLHEMIEHIILKLSINFTVCDTVTNRTSR
jgi:hypothetical protein